MTRNDPDALEAEAEELIKQLQGEQGTLDEDQEDPEGTPSKSEELDQEEPTEPPSETGDEASGDGDEPAESGEQDEPEGDIEKLREQLRVAEERYKNAQARMTKATQEAAALRREVDSLKKENTDLKAQREQQKEKPTGSADEDADLDKLLEDYPDVVGPLVRELRVLQKQFSEKDERDTRTAQERALDEHFASIASAHSDWEDIVAQDDWQGWLDRQSPLRRRAAQEGTADEVIELLDAYKRDMGITVAETRNDPAPPQETAEEPEEAGVQRPRKQAEPRVPKARKPDPHAGKRIFTMAEIQKMKPEQYEKLEAEIDKAIEEGRVRY
jgi:chromosome segregation ATPase